MHNDASTFLQMKGSCLFFTKTVLNLVPQPLKQEYKKRFTDGLKLKGKAWDKFCATVNQEWFEEYIDGKHITWQQAIIFYGVDKAIHGDIPLRISIVSGHGIGKSCMLSILILWFLFVHPDCQVACTSPGQQQLYDILWKEIKKWIDRMPRNVSDMYIWESSHIRMKESPQVWFARAKTASKENSEALAGVHADWVMMAVDEASGVDEQIFETMEGSLTSGNILVFLISNGTRANGYFYDTHHKDKDRWQNYKFSSLDSPRVDKKYVQSIIDKYGEDSIQYAIRVKGEFPKEDGMDDSGYIPLLQDKNIITRPDEGQRLRFSPNSVLGVDPAGDGDDKTSWVIRDNFKAKKLYEESKSTAKSVAERTLTFMNEYNIRPRNVVVDAFGVGADVGKEIAIASKGQVNVTTVNTGDKCELDREKDVYLNKRAMCFYEAKKWLQQGGELIENGNFKEELLGIRYKRNLSGLIQIMPKIDMKKKYGLKSPNDADAFSLTFLRSIPKQMDEYMEKKQKEIDDSDFDQFAVI